MTTALQPLDFHKVSVCPVTEAPGFSNFRSGISEIDIWCRDKAIERHRANKSRVFCAVLSGEAAIAGFYSTSMRGSDPKHIAPDIVRDYNEGGFVPFIYIDYLAVRTDLQRRQLGTFLLMDALRRCRVIVQNMGCLGVALNSITPQATAWYERFGFRQRQKGATQFPLMVLPAQSLLELPEGN